MNRLRRKLLSVLPWLAIATGVSSCGSDEPEPTPTPVPEPPPVTYPVGRTVLVYMVANNSLGSGDFDGVTGFDGLDLEEMKVAAVNGDLGNNRLMVYHVPRKGDVALKEVCSDGELRTLSTYSRDEYSTSAKRMREVISDAKTLAPADNYGLILWSHGSGWLEDGIEESRTRSFGEDSGKKMNVSTLADVLDGEEFDYVYFDCCFMASVEVAYELRHSTPMIVGSATELPSRGMPYDSTLRYLMADEPDLIKAAETVFSTYDALDGWERTSSMSVISTAGMEELAGSVGNLMAKVEEPISQTGVQRFYSRGRYFDLEHYLEKLAGESGEHADELQKCKDALERVVVYRNATPWLWEGLKYQVRMEHHCGLSTNIVGMKGDELTYNYDLLEWWEEVASKLWNR